MGFRDRCRRVRDKYREHRAEKYAGKTQEQLIRAANHCTRSMASSKTSSYVSLGLAGITGGLSLIPGALSVPMWWKSWREKRHIKRLLKEDGHEYHSRKRDKIFGTLLGGSVSVLTQGVGSGAFECIDTALDHSAIVGDQNSDNSGMMKKNYLVHGAIEGARDGGWEGAGHAVIEGLVGDDKPVGDKVWGEVLTIPAGLAAERAALQHAKTVARRR